MRCSASRALGSPPCSDRKPSTSLRRYHRVWTVVARAIACQTGGSSASGAMWSIKAPNMAFRISSNRWAVSVGVESLSNAAKLDANLDKVFFMALWEGWFAAGNQPASAGESAHPHICARDQRHKCLRARRSNGILHFQQPFLRSP